MKQNKLLIVGMLVLPILLSACGGVQPEKIDAKPKSQSWSAKDIKSPISVAKEAIDASYEDQKKMTQQIKYILQAFQLS